MTVNINNISKATIRKAAVDHPVGKTSFKTGALTAAQIAQIKAHPELEVSMETDSPAPKVSAKSTKGKPNGQ